ncbi:hypothetical protein [Roseivirga misakiensis]|uniref:Uncharacterized protein n=1 Tax=Roseivirga misakiensis TaxID=1563681 RepID=A0A1E5T4E2_9BACT|nr:hypothetical protein [Roseivirga misakiensis]OEK06254.1 hypothetical protein BFP71_00840 [Roseivirga misakiensis]
MNVKLRQRHRYIWMVMGIALPLLCLEAIEGIPQNVIADIPRHSCTLDIGICGINYEGDSQAIQIEQVKSKNSFGVVVNAPLKSAFTLLYLSNKQEYDESAVLLGAINSMGEYNFDLPENAENYKYLLLADKLNDKTLYHEEFKNQ